MTAYEFQRAAQEIGMYHLHVRLCLVDRDLWEAITRLYVTDRFDKIVGDGEDRHYLMASWVMGELEGHGTGLLRKLAARIGRERARKATALHRALAALHLQLEVL